MLTQYSPKLIESKWYQFWESEGLFSVEKSQEKATSSNQENYCIMLPPPNITGSLHMGHAFQHTVMDCLIRHQRMLGKKVLWQPGTDHAGIATQIVVERQLETQKITKESLGREAFETKIWQWKEQSGGTITTQMRKLGSSVDWSREKFTLDESMVQAVIEVFVKLFDEGLIYQGTRLINWDPKLKTAISDLEVEARTEMGVMYYVNYPLIDEKTNEPSNENFITIATTRPETILADGAIAINPKDTKNTPYLGKTVRVPMTSRNIPIISDEYVDSEFGSGLVKITPAHDYNDYQVGKRHKMEVINLFNDDASMNQNAPKKYQGMDRFEARNAIVSDLAEAGLLVKKEKHSYALPYSERSNVVVEPFLSKQWFVATKNLAAKAKKVVRDKEINFIPENWSKTYFHWLNNIEDWCISRQLWWGHRIPAYYDDAGHVFVATSKKEAEKKAFEYHGKKVTLKQDEDVLDTWFSSALWPFSTLGWPKQTQELEDFYPTNVLVTGFDIIFFWVARMVMFGCHFTGKIPFKEVYITGLICDSDGQKMSKSKGNVIDPLDIIDGIELNDLLKKRTSNMMQPKKAKIIEAKTKNDFPNGIDAHGADALRFSFISQASFGRNIRFDILKIAGYRNFCNKIFNAAKYSLNLINNQDTDLLKTPDGDTELNLFDRWIISRLQRCEKEVALHLKTYRLDMAAEVIYQFVWHEYCDWYLELGKTILQDKTQTKEKKRITARTTILVFEATLRLLHPIMPFITEELWQALKQTLNNQGVTQLKLFDFKSISQSYYPISDPKKIESSVESQVKSFQNIVLAIRQIRSEKKIPFKTPLKIQFHNASEEQKKKINSSLEPLKRILNLSQIDWLKKEEKQILSVSTVVNGLKILVLLEGALDLTEETNKLNKKIEKSELEIKFLKQKLANPNFCNKAPKNLVDSHRQKLEMGEVTLIKLKEQLVLIHK